MPSENSEDAPPDPSIYKKDGQSISLLGSPDKSVVGLPNELISRCLDYLGPADWATLRQVSRKMRGKVPLGCPPTVTAEKLLSFFRAMREFGGKPLSICTTHIDMEGKPSILDRPEYGGCISLTQLQQRVPNWNSCSGLKISDGGKYPRTVFGTLQSHLGQSAHMVVKSPRIITDPEQTHTVTNAPFAGNTKQHLKLIVAVKRLDLMPFRQSGSLDIGPSSFPAFPRPRNISLGVPLPHTAADNTALNASLGSLFESLHEQYGTIQFDNVNLAFGRGATVEDYTAAVRMVNQSKMSVRQLTIGALGMNGGPSLRAIATDSALLPTVSGFDVTIRVDDTRETGYGPLMRSLPIQGSQRAFDPSVSRAPSSSVTFELNQCNLSDLEKLSIDLSQHPDKTFRITDSRGESLREYTAAICAAMSPESELESGASKGHEYRL